MRERLSARTKKRPSPLRLTVKVWKALQYKSESIKCKQLRISEERCLADDRDIDRERDGVFYKSI